MKVGRVMYLRIVEIDFDGYVGEQYPTPNDRGLVVMPLGIFADPYTHDPVWICVAPDRRILELRDHEVEMIA